MHSAQIYKVKLPNATQSSISSS